jgi:hypothetical protein
MYVAYSLSYDPAVRIESATSTCVRRSIITEITLSYQCMYRTLYM